MLLPPPKPTSVDNQVGPAHLAVTAAAPGWNGSEVDVQALSDRVYEFMRYDVRVARERKGDPR